MIKVRLGDIAKTTSGATPLSSIKEYYEDANIPWINSGEVGQYKINKAQKFISEKGFINSNTKFIPKGSVLIAMYGATAGRTSLLNIDNATTNQAICSILPNENISNFFLKYKFDTLYKYLVGISSGSARDNLSQKTIQDLILDLPDLPTQQKIASVLSALDDKIELNNRINAELEAMAKTMYDYWFVQFDFPVASTGSATTTGSATATSLAELVEAKGYKSSGGKMVYNETLKREIPEGWEVKNLGELVTSINTGLNPRDHFKLGEGSNFYVTIKNIEYGRIILDNSCDKINNKSLERIQKRSNLEKGDILFTSIEPVGKTYLLQETPINWNINESVFSFKPNYEYVTSEYLFMLLSSDEIRLKCKNASTGSIHKGIRITPLKNFKIPLPPLNLINEFNSILKEILLKINNNQKQNQELSALRDWLLPMLMNGQVKVG